jgi:zinc/manganese transport system substrate-binding protein
VRRRPLVARAALAGCAGDGGGGDAGGRPSVVVTTSILGEVVGEVVGDAAEVEVLMPVGADPHEFSPSARQAEAVAGADLVVVNGAGLEASLEGVLDEAGGAVFTVADHVDLLPGDPHVWTDPHAMVAVVEALGAAVSALDGVGPGVEARAGSFAAELAALDREIQDLLTPIPRERRVIVTNHQALGYFAARYGLEVVGAVIPSLTTGAAPSSADLEQLAEVIEDERVPAIFAETTSSTDLAEALAESVGDVEVVELFTESLGPPGSGADTYAGMLRTDAERIREALT